MEIKKEDQNIVVAIDKDKASQYALKWVAENYLSKGQTVTLLHVLQKSCESKIGTNNISTKRRCNEVFPAFRCFCARQEINRNEVVVENNDIVAGIIDYVATNFVDMLVLGSPKGGIARFKITDVPNRAMKAVPEYCSVYVINKGKVSSRREATKPPPPRYATENSLESTDTTHSRTTNYTRGSDRSSPTPSCTSSQDSETKSPFNKHVRPSLIKAYESYNPADCDISFVSSGRSSMDRMSRSSESSSDVTGFSSQRLSNTSDLDHKSSGSRYSGNFSNDLPTNLSESGGLPLSSTSLDDTEAEMRRIKLELKQTMEMYNSACKEAITAKQKAKELHLLKLEEQQRIKEARLAEEAALALVEKEKTKCKAAIEAAEAAKCRLDSEIKAFKEADAKRKALATLTPTDVRYRRYTAEEIEEATEDFSDSLKIGEGGYGPVYKGDLYNTPVAIKVLRSDAGQKLSQFQQEVEVLSRTRHPYMVLLLGACPEYGCLVYEYMAYGSLEKVLFRRGNTPPLSWQARFRIAADIGTALLFLHQTKPEPIVHRDLKPGNILLDRNLVSKISDVGMAGLFPSSVTDSVTQYRVTSTAGTFCYIDPEYQQTGILGTKSDIYSFGIMLLQIITAKPPMGLIHYVERAIKNGTFEQMLDPEVTDWPTDEALKFAKIALQCAELKKKDRPDLRKIVLPELNRLRVLGEENTKTL